MITENIIKSARQRAGLKQIELAEKLGISTSALSQLESGNLTIKKASEICEKMSWKFICKIRLGEKEIDD